MPIRERDMQGAGIFLRMFLNHTLHNPIGKGCVESHLSHLLSFGLRGDTRIQVLLDHSNKLQILRVRFAHRLRDLSNATAVAAEISVSSSVRQHRRRNERDGDRDGGHRSNVYGAHGFRIPMPKPQ